MSGNFCIVVVRSLFDDGGDKGGKSENGVYFDGLEKIFGWDCRGWWLMMGEEIRMIILRVVVLFIDFEVLFFLFFYGCGYIVIDCVLFGLFFVFLILLIWYYFVLVFF